MSAVSTQGTYGSDGTQSKRTSAYLNGKGEPAVRGKTTVITRRTSAFGERGTVFIHPAAMENVNAPGLKKELPER